MTVASVWRGPATSSPIPPPTHTLNLCSRLLSQVCDLFVHLPKIKAAAPTGLLFQRHRFPLAKMDPCAQRLRVLRAFLPLLQPPKPPARIPTEKAKAPRTQGGSLHLAAISLIKNKKKEKEKKNSSELHLFVISFLRRPALSFFLTPTS